MELSNELLDECSGKLRRAVSLTLKLDTDEKIFVGNEERMFLYALIQRFWGTPHVKERPIKNFINITNYNFYDIWKMDFQNTSDIKGPSP